MAESTPKKQLTDDEQAELERLRRESARHNGRWARRGRWAGASVLLLIGALIGTLAVVAVFVRAEVLNTETYVQTVAPLATEPAVQDAVARRLTDEIIVRSDVKSLANQAATQLEARGAPNQLSDLVGPLMSGLNSFLYNQIHGFLGTARFQTMWENINRDAHQGLVTVLTGQQGQIVKSQGNTVTLDIGALLTMAKQQLVAQGFTLADKVPNVSISYTLLQSDQLPKVRTYTKLLNTVGTWLPWVALAFLFGGVALAPHRRRGIIVGAVLLGVTTALVLLGMNVVRSYYLDHLPANVSVDAVTEVYDTVVRFLISALEALLTAAVVFLIGALVAGPSWLAVRLRRLVNWGLDAFADLLRKAGSWVATTGRAIVGARHAIQIGLVVLALLVLVLINQPSAASVLWTTVILLVVVGLVESVIRAGIRAGGQASARPRPAS